MVSAEIRNRKKLNKTIYSNIILTEISLIIYRILSLKYKICKMYKGWGKVYQLITEI